MLNMEGYRQEALEDFRSEINRGEQQVGSQLGVAYRPGPGPRPRLCFTLEFFLCYNQPFVHRSSLQHIYTN